MTALTSNRVAGSNSTDETFPSVLTPGSAIERIVVAHGGGGELTAALVREHFLPRLTNKQLEQLSDSAVLPWSGEKLVFTTDSYVVTPIEFPGGDIGRLAVCGTVNDLAVMGAKPVALSLGMILEEGLPVMLLDRVVASIEAACREAGVAIVTGDTKVIESRQPVGGPSDESSMARGLFINTAGVGTLLPGISLDVSRISPGDAVLVSGTLAEHGLTILAAREGMEFESSLTSDAAPLNHMIASVLGAGSDIRFMRDATRGGIASVLADICELRDVSIVLEETALPITPTARHAAELFGLDPLTIANEGKVVIVTSASAAEAVVNQLRRHPLGQNAAIIGRVTAEQPPLVELRTAAGGSRIVQRPYGEELPRIC
ncbi:Hydrogenase expression/formation protein HypE [Phycisphaerae bacterium RAS2]|nr:Hydrogenase expression/formation protein HypE [Phycisphaerae bacterium RAS2]